MTCPGLRGRVFGASLRILVVVVGSSRSSIRSLPPMTLLPTRSYQILFRTTSSFSTYTRQLHYTHTMSQQQKDITKWASADGEFKRQVRPLFLLCSPRRSTLADLAHTPHMIQVSSFRDVVEQGGKYAPEKGRYHLCVWRLLFAGSSSSIAELTSPLALPHPFAFLPPQLRLSGMPLGSQGSDCPISQGTRGLHRYDLCLDCFAAQRADELRSLDPPTGVSVVHPHMLERGWSFDKDFPAATGDTLGLKSDKAEAFTHIRDLYHKVEPSYDARYVPVYILLLSLDGLT